jgi:hypothetical protein
MQIRFVWFRCHTSEQQRLRLLGFAAIHQHPDLEVARAHRFRLFSIQSPESSQSSPPPFASI